MLRDDTHPRGHVFVLKAGQLGYGPASRDETGVIALGLISRKGEDPVSWGGCMNPGEGFGKLRSLSEKASVDTSSGRNRAVRENVLTRAVERRSRRMTEDCAA
jgi:hypothetical protein